MQTIDRLLLENKAWAQEQIQRDPQYFEKLRQPRSVDCFWIGCSDSRVHADQITQTDPGEIFVHRNIANQAMPMDMNLLAALEYAVDTLNVKHIIVCGHYGCGGIHEAMRKGSPDSLFTKKWLRAIRNVYRIHRAELEGIPSPVARENRLVELNVIEQVQALALSSPLQKVWRQEKRPDLHGWVYGLNDGIISEIARITADTALDSADDFGWHSRSD